MSDFPQSYANTPPFVVVSRYVDFPQLVRLLGLVDDTAQWFRAPHPEDIRGAHVVTDGIGVGLASYASAVTVIELAIPSDLDSEGAVLPVLRQFAREPRTFVVRGGSVIVGEIFRGGPTPSATLIASRLLRQMPHSLLTHSDEDAVAAVIDAGMAEERHAGEESERLLMRVVAAERCRRESVEALLLLKGAPEPSNVKQVAPKQSPAN